MQGLLLMAMVLAAAEITPLDNFASLAVESGGAPCVAYVQHDGTDDTVRGEPLEYGRITSNRRRPWLAPDVRVWAPLTLDFRGPLATESDSNPNPFLDYRLQVLFEGPSGQKYNVPGYFDGDGQGGTEGEVWQVRFSPDEVGPWNYVASFCKGKEAAVSLALQAGNAVCFDGAVGTFSVAPPAQDSPDFLKWGRLEYVGAHYLKFRDGPYSMRGGVNSPEDFLAYAGFDNTLPSHRYADHASDWRPDDPDWGDGKGRAIIGAINYLASKHVNSLYFMPMTVGGDGCNVWPWAGSPDPKGNADNDNLHFDLAKLTQWETVFAHAQRNGIFLHCTLNEAEKANKRELDDAELGTERKLFYREMVARFSHHVAIQWNLSEEYNVGLNLGPDRIREFADYLQAIDPYGHPITVHPAGDPLEELRFTFGDARFSTTSIQTGQRQTDTITEAFRKATADSGRPLPACLDEFTIEAGQKSLWDPVDDADRLRIEKLWPIYLSGGNIEFILEDMLETESFKTPGRDKLWDYVWYARRFLEALPFWEMEPADELLSNAGAYETTGRLRVAHQKFVKLTYQIEGQVLAKPGEAYAVYLPEARQGGTLDLSADSGMYVLRWYNPRTGKFVGAANKIASGARVPLGKPPIADGDDWAVLIEREKP